MLDDPKNQPDRLVQKREPDRSPYAHEVCDACEVDSLGYQIDDILVSDFLCLHSQFLNFLPVILAIQDVPLLRAFKDGALLALYFLASGLIYFFFLVEQIFKNLAGFLPDGVWIFNKLDFVHLLEDLGHSPRQDIYFVTAQPHSTALYLRTSSLFTLRNIS